MNLMQMFNESAVFGKITLFIGLLPFLAGVRYAWNPTERRLTLLRPLSLASTFAALSGVAIGLATVLAGIAVSPRPLPGSAFMGFSEAFGPAVVNFGLLAAAWLLVGAGMVRRTSS